MSFIAEIDSVVDICIYLNKDNLNELSNNALDGILIKGEKPKRQGTINVSVNEKRKTENGFEIGIDDKKYWGVRDNFHLDVFLGTDSYKQIMERGKIEIRHRMRDGSKIAVYNLSKLDDCEKIHLEQLEFYINNKDKLPDYMG